MKTKITIQNKDWSIEHTTWPVSLVKFIEEYKNAIYIVLESKHSTIEMTKLKDGNYRMTSKLNKKWFTLIEFIVLITILWILMTIAFITYTETQEEQSWNKYIIDISEEKEELYKPMRNRIVDKLELDSKHCLITARDVTSLREQRDFIFKKCMKLLWY